jgi:putative redox protein
VSFTNASGDTLTGRLEMPLDRQPRAFAVFAHCFTCGKDLRGAVELTRALTLDGYAVLRFDFTGLGESEGEFAATTFSSTADDIVAACDFLAAEYSAPQLLVGHSLGGTAMLRAVSRVPSAKAVVTIGAPADAEHVTHLFRDQLRTIESEGDAKVQIAGRTFTLRREFLDDARAVNMEASLAAMRTPLLVMHAPLDNIVGLRNAEEIFKAAWHPKSFLALDGADHLLSQTVHAEYAARTLAAWASRYVADTIEPDVDELVAREDVVTRTGTRGYRTQIRAGTHGFEADEPVAVGGEDAGPSPYDLLLAALGACTGMTLRMYADRKGWPLESATVHLTHSRVHAVDGQAAGSGDVRTDHIERTIVLAGALDDEQRARLMEIADRCPVHRTLERGVHVTTRDDSDLTSGDG